MSTIPTNTSIVAIISPTTVAADSPSNMRQRTNISPANGHVMGISAMSEKRTNGLRALIFGFEDSAIGVSDAVSKNYGCLTEKPLVPCSKNTTFHMQRNQGHTKSPSRSVVGVTHGSTIPGDASPMMSPHRPKRLPNGNGEEALKWRKRSFEQPPNAPTRRGFRTVFEGDLPSYW